MKIIKGDTILVIKGRDKGKKGKVLKSFPKENKVLVEGINVKKERKRPRKEGEKGQTVEVPATFDVSKAKLICPKCSKPSRVGFRLQKKQKKERICKKCQQTF